MVRWKNDDAVQETPLQGVGQVLSIQRTRNNTEGKKPEQTNLSSNVDQWQGLLMLLLLLCSAVDVCGISLLVW